jgi:hypothetical protein
LRAGERFDGDCDLRKPDFLRWIVLDSSRAAVDLPDFLLATARVPPSRSKTMARTLVTGIQGNDVRHGKRRLRRIRRHPISMNS